MSTEEGHVDPVLDHRAILGLERSIRWKNHSLGDGNSQNNLVKGEVGHYDSQMEEEDLENDLADFHTDVVDVDQGEEVWDVHEVMSRDKEDQEQCEAKENDDHKTYEVNEKCLEKK